MSNEEINISAIVDKVKGKLPEYIALHNIEVNDAGKFLCPAHDEETPSAGVRVDNPIFWKCFGCGAGNSIYDLAHYVENLEIDGANFLKATRHLMDQFDDLKSIDKFSIPKTDVITENIKRINTYILDLLRQPSEGKNIRNKYTVKRSWDEETCSKLGIGTIAYKEVKEYIIKKMGIDIEEKGTPYKDCFLKSLFSVTSITFTLFDHMNRPIGFSTRAMTGTGPKYINTPGVKNIFNKSKHMYQIANAIKPAKKAGFIYVMEGNADVATAFQHGIENCTAMCGTALTENQIRLIHSVGINHIILCTDADTAGIKSIKSFLNKFTYLDCGVHVDIVNIPEGETKEDSDPDYFIKSSGTEEFKKLQRYDAFKWLIMHTEETAPDKIVEELVPHIALISSNSAWQDKIKLLSEMTGIEEEYIKEDIRIYKDQDRHNLQVERQKIIKRAFSESQGGSESSSSVLQEAIKKIEELESSKGRVSISPEQNIMETESIFRVWETYDPKMGITGWETGYKQLDEALDGIPKSEAYMAFPGLPHVGKSAILLNVMVNMLLLTEEGKNEDLSIYLMTIDDSTRAVYSRIVGIITNIPMRNIKKFSAQEPETKKMIMEAHELIQKWIRKGHLYIADASLTTNIERGIKNMLKLREKFPEKKNLFVLDNFHKLSAPSTGEKERQKWVALSALIHEKTVADRFTCMSTFELNKTSHNKERPGLVDISETGSIEYDCQVIALCHNDFYVKQGDTEFKWMLSNQEYPVMELNLAKNKINEYKKMIYFKFNTSTTKMVEVDDIEELKRAAKGMDTRISEEGNLEI